MAARAHHVPAEDASVLAALARRFDGSVLEIPTGQALVRLIETGGAQSDVLVRRDGIRVLPGPSVRRPAATLTADPATWSALAGDATSGMSAYRAGRLRISGSLHIGVGFIAATSDASGPGRLRLLQLRTRRGTVSTLTAGEGTPVVFVHGLGATKASFLPTIAALAGGHRCIAIDLPGFGDSDKPLFAPYDARFFSRWIEAVLDTLELDRAHIVGHSMGGRAVIEFGLQRPERVRKLVLMMPSLAWRRNRDWANLLRLVRPEFGMLQITPRPVAERLMDRLIPSGDNHWVDTAKDEFLRSFLTPSGRAAFYAAARHIYLEKPDGPDGFWSRLSALSPPPLFIWGRQDRLVPVAFRRHVAATLPAAKHCELDCGHVPQLEAPRAVHTAIRDFLG